MDEIEQMLKDVATATYMKAEEKDNYAQCVEAFSSELKEREINHEVENSEEENTEGYRCDIYLPDHEVAVEISCQGRSGSMRQRKEAATEYAGENNRKAYTVILSHSLVQRLDS